MSSETIEKVNEIKILRCRKNLRIGLFIRFLASLFVWTPSIESIPKWELIHVRNPFSVIKIIKRTGHLLAKLCVLSLTFSGLVMHRDFLFWITDPTTSRSVTPVQVFQQRWSDKNRAFYVIRASDETGRSMTWCTYGESNSKRPCGRRASYSWVASEHTKFQLATVLELRID